MAGEIIVSSSSLPSVSTAPDANQIENMVRSSTAMHECVAKMFKEGVHFGIIPGCKKPSLYQPGAELLQQLYRLGIDSVMIDVLEHDAEEISYRVTIPIKHLPTGHIVGYGVGEGSTSEEKWKWRASVCDEEWDDAPSDKRRTKYAKRWNKSKGGYDSKKVKQVRQEPADLANTILQMATKRAIVSGTRRCTAASDIFTDNVPEDSNGNARTPSAPQRKQQAPKTMSKPAPTPTPAPAPKAASTPVSAPATPQEQELPDQPTRDLGNVITEKQRGFVGALLSKSDLSEEEFYAWLGDEYGVGHISEIPFGMCDAVRDHLKANTTDRI